jgi:hypothetical protein
MRQLDHPNIIKLVEFLESRQYYYIILELAPGGELFHQIVRLTYFSEDLSRHVITQVAEALHYLHEVKGVVHRYDLLVIIPEATTDVMTEILNQKTYYLNLFHSFQARTRSQDPPKMRIKSTRASLLRALELVASVE